MQAAHLAEVDAENGRRALGLELQTAKERLERALASTAEAEAESAELLAEVHIGTLRQWGVDSWGLTIARVCARHHAA